MNLTNLKRRIPLDDHRKLTLDHFTKQEKAYFLGKDSNKHTYAKTFHISENKGQSLSIYSEDSDNDIFVEGDRKIVNRREIKSHSKSKVLQQYSYLTQKMMPDLEKNMNTISVIESKVYQINIHNQENNRKNQTLNEGEVMIKYNPEQHPILLQPELINIQNLRQQEFYYYKIKCKDELVPLAFQMNLVGQTKFKIFLSSTNPFPSKFSSEQIYQVKKWKYKSHDTNYFRMNFIYLSLVCDLDTTVKLSFQFGSITKTTVQSPMKYKTVPDVINCTLTAAQIIQKRKRQMLQLAQGKDLIQQNIMNITLQNDDSFQASRKEKRSIQIQKIVENAKKRKLEEINQQGQKEYDYYQKAMLQMIKKQQTFIKQKKQNEQDLYLQWFMIIAISKICQVIQKRMKYQYHLVKHVQIIQLKMKRVVHRVQRNIIKMKGVHIYDRVHLDTRFCLSIFCKGIYKKHQTKAIELVFPILKTRALIWNFRVKMQQTSNKLNKIRDGIYDFVLRFRNYRNFVKQVFEKNFDNICMDSFGPTNQTPQQVVLWYNQSRYLMYFQYIANIFQQEFCLKRYKEYYKNIRKERIATKALRRSSTKFIIEINPKKSRLFTVPQLTEIQKLIPIIFELTKNQAENYCKDNQRRIVNRRKTVKM